VRILIVEDDPRLARSLRRGLEEEGYGVDAVRDGEGAIAAAAGTEFDALVLDVMLPGRWDGFGVCAELRRRDHDVPVLMLTARDGVEDRVRGLDSGADDYLVKPFAFGELLARLRALTRRHLGLRSPVLDAGPIRLDTVARSVTAAGQELGLTVKELAILEYLMRHPNQVVTKSQIEEHVWNYDFHASSNLVEVYVARLRRKLLGAGAGDPIVTLRRAGYRFTPEPPCTTSSAEPGSD
jgi:DNA-binding response OmpR family regulator